jgi:hypothetical protein
MASPTKRERITGFTKELAWIASAQASGLRSLARHRSEGETRSSDPPAPRILTTVNRPIRRPPPINRARLKFPDAA